MAGPARAEISDLRLVRDDDGNGRGADQRNSNGVSKKQAKVHLGPPRRGQRRRLRRRQSSKLRAAGGLRGAGKRARDGDKGVGAAARDSEPPGDGRVHDALRVEFVHGEHDDGSAGGGVADALGPAEEHGADDGGAEGGDGGGGVGAGWKGGGGGGGSGSGGCGEEVDGVGGGGGGEEERREAWGGRPPVGGARRRFSPGVGGFCCSYYEVDFNCKKKS